MTRFACTVAVAALTALLASGCHQNSASAPPLPGSSYPTYAITDIGVGSPGGLNDNGQVVGDFPAGVFPHSKGFPYFHGCLWNKGKRTEMPTLGGWYSKADAIDNAGRILGSASVRAQDHSGLPINHVCFWDGAKLTDLEADPRFRATQALHITKSGAIYAVSPPQSADFTRHLWFYPAGLRPGPRIDRGNIGGPLIEALAINDRGSVIGTWNTGKKRGKSAVKQAFIWHPGDKHWTSLGTLGGMTSDPTALNNLDQVIGQADLPGDPESPRFRAHAFFWECGKMHDLGVLPGGSISHPYAINSEGQVVGFSDTAQGETDLRPVLWDHGQIKNLSGLIPSGTRWFSLSGAAAINDKGQIAGDGGIEGEHWAHGYLLTPIGYKAVKETQPWRTQ